MIDMAILLWWLVSGSGIFRLRGQNTPERLGAGGSDPTKFWAAESRAMWGRSRPSCVFCPRSFFTGCSAYGLWSWAFTRASDRTREPQLGQNTVCASVFCLHRDCGAKKPLPLHESGLETNPSLPVRIGK